MRTLRIGCTVRPTVLDRDQPLRLLQWENMDGHLQLYEPPTQCVGAPPETAGRPESLEVLPFVAERWEQSADCTTHRFFLRRGLYSAFDHELTAEDVRWGWERSLALGTVGAWVSGNAGLASPDQVQVLDRYVVEFRLPHPNTILPHLFTVVVPTIFDAQVARQHTTPEDPWALRWTQTNGVGFGPYVTEGLTSDGSFRFVKNPRYWRGPLAYDAVDFVEVRDPAERWRALQRGDVDVAIELEVPEGQHDGVVVYHVPTTWRYTMGMNVTRPPFDRVEVRQAVALAVPYERIITEACKGCAKRMLSCVSDTIVGYTPAHHRWEYRPDEARRILQRHQPLPAVKLGYHDEVPALPIIARLIAESLSELGLPVEPALMSREDHSFVQFTKSVDMFLDEFGPMTVDGRYHLRHDVNPPLGGIFDYTGYHSAEIDHLLTAAFRELDHERMKALLAEVQRIALHDVPWVPLAQQKFCFGVRGAVIGYRWYPLARLRCRDLRPRG
ncbi:MAG: hypothetical protein HYU88_14490 [Chloroflexi bacterium]|nr:hypothetical protein [Chloroflexota bacterium]